MGVASEEELNNLDSEGEQIVEEAVQFAESSLSRSWKICTRIFTLTSNAESEVANGTDYNA